MPSKKNSTAAERSLDMRAKALRRWANTDTREGTKPAREAANARFLREVDPNNELDPVERAVRADRARRAFMAEIAAKGLRTRRLNAQRRAAAQNGGGA